ncbi:MAG: formylglycine-generating enzyme family protein, partial [Synechococcus sp.]
MIGIPGCTFVMGSPEEEEGRWDDEGPQHEVTVSSFWMGMYEVTQAQWQAMASLPRVDVNLDPNLSFFKEANRPVESVSWYEAEEFCKRLSRKADCDYRLPSEAEWEYACRAKTHSPFHFGETIATELANYRGTDLKQADIVYPGNYGFGPRGKYREVTTKVGSFPTKREDLRVLCGGTWGTPPQDCRLALRY